MGFYQRWVIWSLFFLSFSACGSNSSTKPQEPSKAPSPAAASRLEAQSPLAPYIGVWQTTDRELGGDQAVAPWLIRIQEDGTIKVLFEGDDRLIAPDRLEYSEDYQSHYFVYDPREKPLNKQLFSIYPSSHHVSFVGVSPIKKEEGQNRFQIETPSFRPDIYVAKPSPDHYISTFYSWMTQVSEAQVAERIQELSKTKNPQTTKEN